MLLELGQWRNDKTVDSVASACIRTYLPPFLLHFHLRRVLSILLHIFDSL